MHICFEVDDRGSVCPIQEGHDLPACALIIRTELVCSGISRGETNADCPLDGVIVEGILFHVGKLSDHRFMNVQRGHP